MQGKIIKGIAGFYYVACKDRVYECKAKGIFRNRRIKPLVGDEVDFEVLEEADGTGNIVDILPRRNEILRPALSNIDLALVVLAVAKPKPQLSLLDKYLISLQVQGVDTAIVWNKADLEEGQSYLDIYRAASYPCFLVSSKENRGLEELFACMRGKSVALAGPSGVGKSSIINRLAPMANMETASISRKIERGRHTTRHSEFFVLSENTYLCDTPGFTALQLGAVEAELLKRYYPEFYPYEGGCRFHACTHLHEPGCKVKEALQEGKIYPQRYESYKKNYEELKAFRAY